MLSIDVNELKLNKYKAFISHAFYTCDSLSYVADKENQKLNDFLKSLEINCLADILKKEFISVHPYTGTDFDCGCYMLTLKCNTFIKSLFLRADCIADFNGIEFPEDLCFYRDGNLWFKFISHEKLIFITNEEDSDIKFFKFNKIL